MRMKRRKRSREGHEPIARFAPLVNIPVIEQGSVQTVHISQDLGHKITL